MQDHGSPGGGMVATFEANYRHFAPLLRIIAIRKFDVPPADAEALVESVFITYLHAMDEVESVEKYLIGSICNASRYYHHPTDVMSALFCGETPCAATPTDEILQEVERMVLLSRMRARDRRRNPQS